MDSTICPKSSESYPSERGSASVNTGASGNIGASGNVGAIELPMQMIEMTQDYLKGANLEKLALKYSLPVAQVSEFLGRKEVKNYISQEMSNYKMLNLRKRIDLLSRLVDEKIEFAEENELPTSNKDIVEILKLLREESKDIQSADVEQDTGKQAYIQIINNLKSD